MSRDKIKLRNAVTELWNDGYSVPSIAHSVGLPMVDVLNYLESARRGFHTPRDEVESVSLSKPPTSQSKVIPHSDGKDRLGARVDPVAGTLVTQNDCRVCGKAIQPSGKRGRPRKIHQECR